MEPSMFGRYPVKFAEVDAATLGDNEIVVAVTGKKIRVVALSVICSGGSNTLEWRSSTTPISGGMGFGSSNGYSPKFEFGLFETNEGEALNLNLSAATSVDGHISYIEV